MDAPVPMNVIDRLKEQLKLAGKVRGFKKPIYKDVKGKKELQHYARQMIQVQCADIIELCGLARNKEDEIVIAQLRGHTFGLSAGGQGKAAMYADDLFHLIELATPPFIEPVPQFAEV